MQNIYFFKFYKPIRKIQTAQKLDEIYKQAINKRKKQMPLQKMYKEIFNLIMKGIQNKNK